MLFRKLDRRDRLPERRKSGQWRRLSGISKGGAKEQPLRRKLLELNAGWEHVARESQPVEEQLEQLKNQYFGKLHEGDCY